jgi:hypothetical protein
MIAVVIGFLGLLTLNVLTLVDDGIHAKAYGVLESVVQGTVAGPMLKNSSTEVRRRDVAVATQVLRSQKDHLARQTMNLVAATNIFISNASRLQAEKAEVEALLRTWKTKYSRAQAATQRFSRGVAQRLAKGANRTVSLLVGKAVPYFGIAVTVAMTSLDLKDSCDTVKEINQLALSMEETATDESTVCGLSVPTKKAVVDTVSDNFARVYTDAQEVLDQAGNEIPPLPSSTEASKAVIAFVKRLLGGTLW